MTADSGSLQLSQEQRQLLEVLLRQRGLDRGLLSIARRRDTGPAPLSSVQRRLWSSGALAGNVPYGNVAMAFRVKGPLRVDLIERGLNAIIRRHEVLRTTFPVVAGDPVQQIAPELSIAVRVEDFAALPEAERESTALARLHADARRPFDVAREPLLRAAALKLGEDQWMLLLVAHHLVTDGWGARLLLRELSVCYETTLTAPAVSPAPLPIQFADYAVWEHDWLGGEAVADQIRHWTEKLRGAPRLLDLPTDRPRAAATSLRCDTRRFTLTAALSRRLRALSREAGVTSFITLLACFQTLLHQYARQNEVLVGTLRSNRDRPETEEMIGNFGNNLFFRTGFTGDPTVAEILGRVRDVVIDAFAHPDVPIETLANASQRIGTATPVPQFQVMFILRDGSPERYLSLPGLQLEAVPLGATATTLELVLDVTDDPEELVGELNYRTDLFDATTIDWMARHFTDFVGRFAEDPGLRLSDLPLLALAAALPDVCSQAQSAGSSGPPHASAAVSGPRHEGPQTETQEALAAIWAQALGIERVGISDDFFNLGGDSLRAVRVLSEVRARFSADLPARILFEARTVADLADLVDSRLSSTAPGAEDPEGLHEDRIPSTHEFLDRLRQLDVRVWADGDRVQSSGPSGTVTPTLRAAIIARAPEILALLRARAVSQTSLVPIQPMGSRPPFFGVPAHNGDVFCYVRLARHLGQDQPLLAYEPPGMDGRRPPLARVEELAAHFVRDVRSVQPKGPYRLGGYCLGGLVAFEAAQQLRDQGEEVALLALFESPSPTANRLSHRLGRDVRRVARNVRVMSRMSPREQWRYLRGKANDKLADFKDRVGQALLAGARRYVGDVYPGRIDLFLASEESARLSEDRPGDWATFATQRLAIHVGPEGCHRGVMLQEPHVQGFAERLRQRLDEVQTKEST